MEHSLDTKNLNLGLNSYKERQHPNLNIPWSTISKNYTISELAIAVQNTNTLGLVCRDYSYLVNQEQDWTWRSC